MKIRPERAELLDADRRTDITKLIVAFRNFAKAPKNVDVKLTLVSVIFISYCHFQNFSYILMIY
jgi:hypothetical protein